MNSSAGMGVSKELPYKQVIQALTVTTSTLQVVQWFWLLGFGTRGDIWTQFVLKAFPLCLSISAIHILPTVVTGVSSMIAHLPTYFFVCRKLLFMKSDIIVDLYCLMALRLDLAYKRQKTMQSSTRTSRLQIGSVLFFYHSAHILFPFAFETSCGLSVSRTMVAFRIRLRGSVYKWVSVSANPQYDSLLCSSGLNPVHARTYSCDQRRLEFETQHGDWSWLQCTLWNCFLSSGIHPSNTTENRP